MSSLHEALVDRIRREKSMSFARLMAIALYGDGGYYRQERHPTGRSGDYATSPQIHPAFGALLSLFARELAGSLGDGFGVAEYGCGDGNLARAFLAFARQLPGLSDARYHLWDHRDPGLPGAVWHAADTALPEGFRGLVLANELVDAFPVHRVVRDSGGQLREQYVVLHEDGLAFECGPLSDPALAGRVAELEALAAMPLPAHAVAELPVGLEAWLFGVACSLEAGIVLLVDYGGPVHELWKRPGGTLRAFCGHRHSDPLQALGLQDLTASVAFDALQAAASRSGFQVLGETSQREFLEALGLGGWMAGVPRDEAMAMGQLVAHGGMGDFRVLALGKGLPDAPLPGFGPAAAPLAAGFPVPLRSCDHLDDGPRTGWGGHEGLWADLLAP